MKRNRRTRILVNGSAELRSSMAASVLTSNTVLEIEPPTEGLVMLTVRETARGGLFHLGELLVTESKARIGQVLGLGIVAGSNPTVAWELAVIDAAFNAALPQTEGWEEMLVREEEKQKAAQAREDGRILQTRVDFKNMELT
jgi:alpha-D-ribose 1-methylphosphonate 5-triphosphate synthase subunit PhnG